jgi:hypothetical protein
MVTSRSIKLLPIGVRPHESVLRSGEIVAESRIVKEMWWEDQDFHIIYKDNNEHVIFKGAYFASHRVEVEQDNDDPTVIHVDANISVLSNGEYVVEEVETPKTITRMDITHVALTPNGMELGGYDKSGDKDE